MNIFYNYFRDYDPITGRYVESDPIGLDGGLNTYEYVGGDVLNFIDSKGLSCERKTLTSIPIGSQLLSSQLIDTLWNPGINTEPYIVAKSAFSLILGALQNTRGGTISTCTLIKNNIYKDQYIKIMKRIDMVICKDECDKDEITFESFNTLGGTFEKSRRESQKYQTQYRTFAPELECIKWFNKIMNSQGNSL